MTNYESYEIQPLHSCSLNYLIINKRMNTFDLNLNMTKEKLNEVIDKQNKCIDCHHD